MTTPQSDPTAGHASPKSARGGRRRIFHPEQEAAIAAFALAHPAATYEELQAFAHEQFGRRADRQTIATTLKRQGVFKVRQARRSAQVDAPVNIALNLIHPIAPKLIHPAYTLPSIGAST